VAEKKSKARSRYSIGEWYGRAFESLSPEERRDQAKLNAGLTTIAGLACPFQRNRICNKKGGVCSLRKYEQIGWADYVLVGKARAVTITGEVLFLPSSELFLAVKSSGDFVQQLVLLLPA
jgi:hypothetical protein